LYHCLTRETEIIRRVDEAASSEFGVQSKLSAWGHKKFCLNGTDPINIKKPITQTILGSISSGPEIKLDQRNDIKEGGKKIADATP